MKKALLPLLAITLLVSCQKSDEEVPETQEVLLLTEMTDEEIHFKFTYNDANQPIAMDITVNAPPAPVATHTATIIYQDGRMAEFRFDPAGSAAEVTTKMVYDSKGNMTEAIRPALKDTTRFTYDDRGRITSHAFKAGGGIIGDEWSYDEKGNVKIDEVHKPGYANPGQIHISDSYLTHTYTYDNKLNPLALNGARQIIAALGLADETNIERVFSANNPTGMIRQTRIVPVNPASNGHELLTYTSSYTNSYDELGYLLTTRKKEKVERFIDGVLQDIPSGEYEFDEVKFVVRKVTR